MNNVTIRSSCGHTLLPGQTATLTAVIDTDQNYRFMWQKKNLNGELLDDWVKYGQTIQITSDEVSEDVTYIVSVIGGQDILTDSSNNILTASFTLYSSEHDVYNAQENDEIIPYVQELTILLTTRGKHIYGKINNIDTQSISYKMNLNSANELSFTVHKEVDGIIEPLWDKIKDFRLVYIKELNEYYQIKISTNNGTNDITKTISATSLCEAELSQIYIRNTEINTEDDIARDDYVVTKFYSLTDKKASLLDRILSFAPHYKIGHVDDSLIELQRSFSIDGTSVYDFLIGDCSEQFSCLFQFNSVTRTINVYDLYTRCLNPECGYRGDFDDVCPKCGSKKISYFGEDTSIFINSKNLSDSITFETDDDSVKNCFKIVGGDDDINAAIRNVNPNGTDVIYYITDDQKEEMSDELVQKINSYDTLYNEKIDTYRTLNQNIYDAYDKILYYTSSMMPDVKHEEVTATTEANKLTVANLSPVGLQEVTTSTSVATVNTALKMLAKVFVKSGYVKVDVDTDNTNTFTYVGTDEQHNHYGTWYGRFKVTNYSNDEDIVYTDYLEIKVYDLYETYLDQKIKKNIVSNDKDGEDSLFDVLTIKSLDNFKEAIKLYCLNRLTSFKSALEGCVFTLVEADQAKKGADLYEGMYLSYLDKLNACEDEIDARQKTINKWQNQLDEYTATRNEIQKSLNFEKYLGEDLYYEFIAYKREDTYSNENYISDGLNNEELLKKAEELIENAQKELYKSAMKQHTITCTLYNLFQMKEFTSIRSKFVLGNWMRILVDDEVYRIGLSSYEVNYGGLESINVEFTDATVAYNTGTSTQSIIDKAQQMATSYSYVSNQAKRGEEARNSISRFLDNGLNTAVTAIKNADSEDIVIDKNGLRARLYDDINDYYAPEQLGILHNMLVFTDDYWRTAKTALGQITYTLDGEEHSVYGLIADVLMSGLIISGHIYSANYSTVNTTGTHIDLENGSFSFAGDKIVYDSLSNDLCLKDITVKFVSDGKIDKTTLQDVITGVNTSYLKLNKLETDIGSKVESSVFNELKQTVDENSSSITSLSTTVSKKADSSTVTALSNKTSKLEQSLNGFKTTVSETYTTKEEFDNLEIGGRNLFLSSINLKNFVLSSSKITLSRTHSAATIKVNSTSSENHGLYFDVDCAKLENNTDYTFSIYVNDYSGFNDSRSPHFSIGSPDGDVWSDITGGYIKLDKGFNYITFNTGEHTRFFRFFIGIYMNNVDSYLTVSNAKLEKGNKATDWTPAPEDVDSSITTLSDKYTDVKQTVDGISATVASHTTQIANKADSSTVTNVSNKVTSLEQNLTGFKTTVSETYATKTALNTVDGKFANYSTTTQMNNAITQAVSAESSSIKSEISKSYVTNSVLSDSLSGIDESIGVLEENLSDTNRKFYDYSTTEQMNNAITQAITTESNSIKLEVSGTYTTKTEFNELQIGGRNLIRAYYIGHFDNGSTDASKYITSGKVVCQGNGAHTGFRFDSINCYEPSTQYILSGYITITSKSCNNIYVFNGKQHSFISFKVDGIAYSNPFDIERTDAINILNDGKPHFFELGYETNANIPADVDVSYTYIQLNKNSTTQINYEINGFKLEKGTKATDWSPAPEDVEAKFNNYATTASLEAYIKKDPTTGELKSAIEAIADDITLSASGTINISGNKSVNINGNLFTLTSTNTTISADGSIDCKKLKAVNTELEGTFKNVNATTEGITMTTTLIGGEYLMKSSTGAYLRIQGHNIAMSNDDGSGVKWQLGRNGCYFNDYSGINIYHPSIKNYMQPALSMSNPVTFDWSGSVLTIYVDNVPVATWDWGEKIWY